MIIRYVVIGENMFSACWEVYYYNRIVEQMESFVHWLLHLEKLLNSANITVLLIDRLLGFKHVHLGFTRKRRNSASIATKNKYFTSI